MTILEILLKAGVAADRLVALLLRVKEELPDIGPEVDKILAALSAAVSAENLVALASALPAEIAAIAQGQLDPRRHPSDIA